MRAIALMSSTLLLCSLATSASAGRIFGDLKVEGKTAPAGLKLRISLAPAAGAPDAKVKLSAAVVDSAVTDSVGSYRLTVKPEGKCILTVLYEKVEYRLEVFSYKEATRYDLLLEKKDGVLALKRK